MQVTVRLFARLRELAGGGELRREVPAGATVAAVWDALVEEFPAMGAHGGSVSAAVNQEFAPRATALGEGDEVAFLPPVSGG
ncbi:MAG: moaD [Acidobacteria bacterium]|jgi:molybdopterin converting factor subunit 1|nr:moaD [Acidobacteriota bacterium]